MADVKWIKITTDIFDDEKVLLIESMPDADRLIVIWFKLLCLAGKQNNSGVFTISDKIAYTDEMLATIFRRPINTVRLALSVFEQYGMIELVNGVITIPNWNKHQSLDALEKKRQYQRELMQKRRAEQKAICEANCDTNCEANVSPLDKNRKDKIRVDKKKDTPVVYFPNDEELDTAFKDFIAMRKAIKKPMTDRAIQLSLKDVNKIIEAKGNDRAIECIELSIKKNWLSIYDSEPKPQAKGAINWEEV